MKQLFRAGLLAVAFSGLAVLPVTAATSKVLYVNTPAGSVAAGAPVTVEVRVDSGAEPVNAVQANLAYDPAKLQYVSVEAVGSAFPLAASTLPTTGLLKLARATAGGAQPSKGDVLFANVKFKALTAGAVSVTIGAGSHVVRSTDSTDLLPTAAGAATPTPTTAGAAPVAASAAEGGFLGLNNTALLAGLAVAAGVLVLFAAIMHFLKPGMENAAAGESPAVKPAVVLPNADKKPADKSGSAKV